MRISKNAAITTFLTVVTCTTPALAHTPLCSCYDNGDSAVLCEGGFSDGASAAGVHMLVKNKDGGIIVEGKMSQNSEFEFKKPEGDFVVIFDGGEGHQIEISSKNISK